MTASVVITGPISPADVEHLLTGRDRNVARSIAGYRGVPVSELVTAFVAMDIDVEVVTEAPDVDAAIELQGPRLRLLIAPERSRARERSGNLFRDERKEMTALLNTTEGAVIHANWTYEFAWAALDTGRPVLVTAHDAPLTILRHMHDAYRLSRTIMAWIVRMRTRNLSAVSPYLAKRWRREMLYRRPIAVIPNIAPALIEQPSRSGLAAELVAIGDAGPLKNMQALVDAWAILRADGREVKLNLIGHGLGRDDAFPRKVTACGLADGIEFHGPLNRESIAEVLSRSKVFVHPSLEECCPLSVLEAMRAGTPVVGGVRSGGVPWVLADGEAGVLIDVRQPFRIAEGIVRLLDDEDESQAIIARARDRVAKHFSARVVCEAYLAEYDRLRSESR